MMQRSTGADDLTGISGYRRRYQPTFCMKNQSHICHNPETPVYFLLLYDYVQNIIERRAPFREAHLALVQQFVATNELVLGGAFDDPADGAVVVFNVKDRERIEDFVKRDPYVANQLVTRWRIRP